MALVRSKRPELFNDGNAPHLGPGSYDPNVPDFRPRNGVAPFGSTSERVTWETRPTPGPGEYDAIAATDIRATRTLHKPSPQFLSKEHRMGRDFAKPTGYDVPGPGAYAPELVRENTPVKPARTLHAASGINWVKVATAPSIPARTQSYGYKEGNLGELIQQPVPYQGHTGAGTDIPGPGYYQVSEKVIRKDQGHKAPQFAKFAYRGELFGKPRAADPGPGSYEADRAALTPVFHGGVMAAKQTHVFSSTTNRAPLRNISYGPGPGAYKPASTFKSLREHLASNPDQFSAFGTSAIQPRAEPKVLDVPGPGSYTGSLIPKPPLTANGEPAPSAAFAGSMDRFHQPPTLGPGPGGYDKANPTLVDAVNSKLRAKYGVFGTTSARLPPPQPATAPPPGTYEPKVDVDPANFRRRDKRTPAFRPNGPRDDPSHKTQGAPTFYEVKTEWPKPSTTAPSLGGTVPRFQGPGSKKEEVPGPGHYPTPHFVAEKARTTQHAGPSVWSKSTRFDSGVTDVPGPGAYVGHTSDSLIKKSFNITIGDTWE